MASIYAPPPGTPPPRPVRRAARAAKPRPVAGPLTAPAAPAPAVTWGSVLAAAAYRRPDLFPAVAASAVPANPPWCASGDPHTVIEFGPEASPGARVAAAGPGTGRMPTDAEVRDAFAAGGFVAVNALNMAAGGTQVGTQPRLFAGSEGSPAGDLPPFTASGIEPALLAQLPWQARRLAARASREQAFAVFARYGDPETGEAVAVADSCPGGPLADDVADYTQAYRAWLAIQPAEVQARLTR